MTVSDGDRFAIAMARLSQARSAVYEATRIIEHLFESDECQSICESIADSELSGSSDSCDPVIPDRDCQDPVTGLYPGQKPFTEINDEEEEAEDVECLE